ncbi:MAG: DUF1573 domain-containing protein [Verrucomicrobia bacterium]|nr:DUF1573 domain-containing protein [Verrucomicrobiota bacterium]
MQVSNQQSQWPWLLGMLAWLSVFAPQTDAQSLTWDAVSKHYESKRGETNVLFTFNLTNNIPDSVLINAVHPSCGCTVAKFPSLPWLLSPGESGKIEVDVDIQGRTGSLTKTIAIESSIGTNILTVNVKFPELTSRELNQQRAFTDRQAVFKQGCAECHKHPAAEKMGKPLFDLACGICHEAEHRAEMVPDIAKLNKPTDHAYWDQWIQNGKPGTFMPAFAKRYGGPLTEEQIASLVAYLTGRGQSSPPEKR